MSLFKLADKVEKRYKLAEKEEELSPDTQKMPAVVLSTKLEKFIDKYGPEGCSFIMDNLIRHAQKNITPELKQYALTMSKELKHALQDENAKK